MNTLIKILLGALATVVVIFVAIAIAVAFVFDPNDYRPLVVDTIRDTTDRDFTLDGDLALDFFPCCGVSVGSATLGNPAGFSEPAFASVESASVSVKIWPLLTRREVQIGTVTVNGLQVHLVELADGRVNWEFETGTEDAAEAADGESPIASLTIEGLEISGGAVTYTGPDGVRYSASNIGLEAGAIGGGSPVPVALQLLARDESTDTEAELEVGGTLSLDGAIADLAQPQISVRAKGTAIPGGEGTAEVNAALLHYDTDAGAGRIDGLDANLSLPGTTVEVGGDLALAGDAVTGNGAFHIPQSNLRQLLEALPDVEFPPVDAPMRLSGGGRWALTATGASAERLDVTLDGSRITGSAALTSFDTGAITADIDIDRLNLDAFLPEAESGAATAAAAGPTEIPFDSLADVLVRATLNVGELVADGITARDIDASISNDGRTLTVAMESKLFGGSVKLNGSGNPGGASPALAGRIELNGVSPRAALTALGEAVETANPDALRQLSGTAGWHLGPRSFRLEQMSWQLDATRLTGSLSLQDFDAPATRFDLALDRIDLDGYLSPDSEGDSGDGAVDVEIPAEAIRGLNVDGRLTAQAMKIMAMDLSNLTATVSAANGVLRLDPLTADLYGGTYRGNIVIDATGPQSRLSLDQQVSAVQMGKVLEALTGSDRLTGALTLNLSGSGAGNTTNQILKALTGNVGFSLNEGVYHGMDIAYEIENAQSLFKRTARPERPNRKETPIKALSFSGSMAGGVLGSDDLNAEIPFLKLGGRGGVNLLERTLDYQLNAQVLKSAEAAPETWIRGLSGSTIPLTISGPLAEPKVGVDMQGLVVEVVKDRARKEIFKALGIDQEPPAGGGAAPDTSAQGTPGTDAPTDTAEPSEQTATDQAAAEPATTGEPAEAEPPSTRDLIERGLLELLRKPEKKEGDGT